MANDGWYPGAHRLPITTQEYYKTRGATLVSACEHITDGTDSRSWLQNANNGSSVHFLIREEVGQGIVYQFMPVQWAAWGNGRFSRNNPFAPPWIAEYISSQPNTDEGNRRVSAFLLGSTVSIEHERKWPFTTVLGEPMLSATIALHSWLCTEYPTLKPDREHIIGHYQVDHVDRAHCPGGVGGLLFPFSTIISAITAPTPAPPPPTPPWVTFSETGQVVRRDFYEYWVQNGGLPLFGYPISPEAPELLPGGITLPVQWFERSRFERQPDGRITLGRLGAELLSLRDGGNG